MKRIENRYLEQIAASPEKTTALVKTINEEVKNKDIEANVAFVVMTCCGIGVEKNVTQALNHAESLARDSQIHEPSEALGFVFHFGLYDTDVNHNRAEELFRSAALNNLKVSAKKLAEYYIKGEHFEKDSPEALRWYQVAAKQGDAEAMAVIGSVLLTGDTGVFGDSIKKDPNMGLSYLSKSAELDHQEAKELLLKHHLKEAARLSMEISTRSPELDDIRSAIDNVKWALR